MKNGAHSGAVTIDFSFQAACKLPQESMSEGENKFLKLAWNTSQEKPSTSQIVMKQKPEQGVIARREGGRQHTLALPATVWGIGLHMGESRPLGNTHTMSP